MITPSPYDLTVLSAVKTYLSANGTVNVNADTDDDNIQRIITGISRRVLSYCGNGSGVTLPLGFSPFNQALAVTENYDGNGRAELWTRMFPIQSVQSLVINGVAVPQSTGFNSYGYQIKDDGKSIVLVCGSVSGRIAPGFRLSSRPTFARGSQNVQLSYTAGFPSRSVVSELQTIPAMPGPYALVVDVLPWVSDAGVDYFIGGAPLTKVLISPGAGEYYVGGGGGYLFNAADEGVQVQISYSASGCPDDLSYAVVVASAFQYKNKDHLTLKSESISGPGGGTTSYEKGEWPDEAQWIIDDYKRTAIIR